MKRIVLVVTIEATAMTAYRGYIRFLKQRGWDVVVIAKSAGALEKWAASEGGRAYDFNFKRNPSLLHDVGALWKTYKLLKKLKPDVVVSATPKAGLIGTLAAKLAKVPGRIYQLWGLRLETESGWKRLILSMTERVTIKAATQCVANSNSLARTAERLGLAPYESIKVLGAGSSHGVDLARFNRANITKLAPKISRFMEVEAGLSIIYVGRITADKGIATLLEAVKEVHERGTPVRLLLVGRIEDSSLEEVLSASPDYVQVSARVEDVAPYIAAADVLCLPTLREGFPNVVLEAAALKIPSIVSDATGARDSVVDGKTGWIFPVNDSIALAKILIDISAQKEELEMRGRHARLRVERHFEQSEIWHLQEENIETQMVQK